MEDVSIFSQWTYHYSSQFQSVFGSDTADLKNNLTQTRPSEFSNPTEYYYHFPLQNLKDVSIFSQWTYHYSSQFQSVSGSDIVDLKNNLTQTQPSEFSDPTEIGGILIPFSLTKSLLWRMFLISPSGPTTIVHNGRLA